MALVYGRASRLVVGPLYSAGPSSTGQRGPNDSVVVISAAADSEAAVDDPARFAETRESLLFRASLFGLGPVLWRSHSKSAGTIHARPNRNAPDT